MTKSDLERAKNLKGELKKLKKTMELLPTMKTRYTSIEYRVRQDFYRIHYIEWMDSLREVKKKLTLLEKIRLVLYNGGKKTRN